MEFFFIYSHVKEAKKKADPYIAQAVDAAMRGWDWTKKTASDIQAKVLPPLSRHTLGHTQINYTLKKNSGGKEVSKSEKRCGEGSGRIRLQV